MTFSRSGTVTSGHCLNKHMAVCEGFKVKIKGTTYIIESVNECYVKFLQDGCYLPHAIPNTIVAGLSVTQGDAGEMPLNSTMR